MSSESSEDGEEYPPVITSEQLRRRRGLAVDTPQMRKWVKSVWGDAPRDKGSGYCVERLTHDLHKEVKELYAKVYGKQLFGTVPLWFARGFAAMKNGQKVNFGKRKRETWNRKTRNKEDTETENTARAKNKRVNQMDDPDLKEWIDGCNEEIAQGEAKHKQILLEIGEAENKSGVYLVEYQAFSKLVNVKHEPDVDVSLLEQKIIKHMNKAQQERDSLEAKIQRLKVSLSECETKLDSIKKRKAMLEKSKTEIWVKLRRPAYRPSPENPAGNLELVHVGSCAVCKQVFVPEYPPAALLTPCFHVYHLYCALHVFNCDKPVCAECGQDIPQNILAELGFDNGKYFKIYL